MPSGLQNSIPPCLQACGPPPENSSAAYLHVARPAACLRGCGASHLHASKSTRLQRASGAPYLHITPTCNAPPKLVRSMPPCRYTCNRLPQFILPCFHVCAIPPPTLHTSMHPCIHTSMHPRHYAYGAPRDLHTSMSTRLQRASRLQSSMPPYLHVATPTARLPRLYSPHSSAQCGVFEQFVSL